MKLLDDDRLFPANPKGLGFARSLFASVRDQPIVSPHGHTDPAWFARNAPFENPAALFVTPDHYVFRMLYSQGVPMEAMGVPRTDGGPVEQDHRKIWQTVAEHFYLFRGTPSGIWLANELRDVFGVEEKLDGETAQMIYDQIEAKLARPEFRPRALFERFQIEVLTTTESPLDSLEHHLHIRDGDWSGRVLTAFRPDPVVDPEFEGFTDNVARLGEITGAAVDTWHGYLEALRASRAAFIEAGATSSDHGHPSAVTADLPVERCEVLFAGALAGTLDSAEAELFRGQMLTKMAYST